MKKPVIGLIGGIGAGKSTVARLLRERGGCVIDADAIAHEALRDPAVRTKIVERFGSDVLDGDGEVDRKKLAAKVFTGESARRELESWVHPWVGERVKDLIRRADDEGSVKFVVLDAAVMLEAGWNGVWDWLIYVYAPREVQLTRLAARGWTPEQIAAREKAQLPLATKAARADATVDNGGPLEATATQLDELLRRWGLAQTESERSSAR